MNAVCNRLTRLLLIELRCLPYRRITVTTYLLFREACHGMG